MTQFSTMASAIIVFLLRCAYCFSNSLEDTYGFESVTLSTVGLGTAGLQQRTHEAVFSALQLGVRMIDSAQAPEWYNEVGVGSAIESYVHQSAMNVKEEIQIVTKVHPRSFALEQMDTMLTASRKNFRRDFIDAVLLHSPWCWKGHCSPEEEAVSWTTGWHNLVNLQAKHNIKAIGVSNFHFEILHQLVVDMDQKVNIVQNWMDPLHQDREVREFCKEHEIQYMGYSSFGTQWNRRPNPVLTHPVLVGIAENHHVSVPQVIMKWLATLNVVAIPRTSNVEHMRDNFAAFIHQRHQTTPASAVTSELVTDQGEAVEEEQCSSSDDGDLVCSVQKGAEGGDGVGGEDGYEEWTLSPEELQVIAELDGTLGNPWD